jgi:hypothetical protein
MRFKGIPIDEISLLNTPKVYLHLTFHIFIDLLAWSRHIIATQAIPIIAIVAAWAAITFIDLLSVISLPPSPSTTYFTSRSTGSSSALHLPLVSALVCTPSSST